jgi:hypothetical protein
VFEVRVVVGRDPVTGASVQRSFTVRGDVAHAEARRRVLVADYGLDLSLVHASAMTVGELLTRWLRAGHAWKPSTSLRRLRARRPRRRGRPRQTTAAMTRTGRLPRRRHRNALLT